MGGVIFGKRQPTPLLDEAFLETLGIAGSGMEKHSLLAWSAQIQLTARENMWKSFSETERAELTPLIDAFDDAAVTAWLLEHDPGFHRRDNFVWFQQLYPLPVEISTFARQWALYLWLEEHHPEYREEIRNVCNQVMATYTKGE